MSNSCYEDSASGRGKLSCFRCAPATSQTELQGPDAGSCFIDGACVADGDPLVVDSGRGPPKVSACAYCDVSKAQDAWSVRTGFDWDSSKAPGEDCGEGSAPPEEKKCDYCGGCYNRDGRHTVECVHGYDAKCWAWYVPVWKAKSVLHAIEQAVTGMTSHRWRGCPKFDFHAGTRPMSARRRRARRRTTTSGAGSAWPRAC